MWLQQLITDYGYLAIVVVTFIEGETIVILAGLAAHMGYLELPWVIVAAIGGSFSGDQFWYYIGRRWGPKVIAKRPSWQRGAQKVYALLHRHKNWLILTFRFYYGLRNLTPFVVGAAEVSRLRFFTLNLIGAIVWAILFAYAGYLLGQASRVGRFDNLRIYLLALLVIIGVAVWLVKFILARRKARQPDQPRQPDQK